MPSENFSFDKTWTLFLDRDGVINENIKDDYVKRWEDFHFLPNAAQALKKLNSIFGTIVIVTNQQGIGKGLYTENDLSSIHKNMTEEILKHGGRIDKIYFASALKAENSEFRKPATGMALQAEKDFPHIKFDRSIIVGDSITDMQFGKAMGMRTVYIKDKFPDEVEEQFLIDKMYPSLFAFAETL
jgi:D-glycero-D-manno-heptose 1,7-bisphosphate phosphatase